jgi:hypothetical protein
MNIRLLRLSGIGLASILIGTACQPKAATPQVDAMATAVAQVASSLLTQTAAAASPTPAASHTPPPPTITITPSPTATVVIPLNQSGQPKLPQTLTDGVSCWLGGPGGTWPLDSHLLHGKGVQLIGVGSVPGWFIIRHPKFHNPCWILQTDLKVFPGTDISTLPVMTPGTPHMGQ